MMVSPKAAQAAGDKFGTKPVCSGPFKFVERVAQDRIVLRALRRTTGTRPPIHFDKITYTPIPDATVRLANLKSGQLDFIERVASSDIEKLKSDKRFKIAQHHRDRLPGHHDQHRQERQGASRTRSAATPRVREAFELALDRQGLAQVVMDNEAQVGQPVGRAEQPVLREEHAGPQARRGARPRAAQGSRRAQSRASR